MAYCIAPELLIDFRENIPGCRVRTPVIGRGPSIEQHYVRLRIRNNGWTTAKNVSVVITGVALGDAQFNEEVLDLQTSISGKPTFDIGRAGYRFVDLFHLVNDPPAVRAAFDFVTTPARFQSIATEPQVFSARVFVSADNASSASRRVMLRWDGTFEGLRIE
jgi:hypothetical protein